jgi:hypothetical protein
LLQNKRKIQDSENNTAKSKKKHKQNSEVNNISILHSHNLPLAFHLQITPIEITRICPTTSSPAVKATQKKDLHGGRDDLILSAIKEK